jgi:hypothetical protein
MGFIVVLDRIIYKTTSMSIVINRIEVILAKNYSIDYYLHALKTVNKKTPGAKADSHFK